MARVIDFSRINPGDIVHLRGRVQAPGVFGRDQRLTVSLGDGSGDYTVPAAAIVRHEASLDVGDHVLKREGITTEGELIAIHGDWGVVADSDGSPPWVHPILELVRAR